MVNKNGIGSKNDIVNTKNIVIEETFYTAEKVAELLGANKKVVEKKLREKELIGSKRFGKWFVLRSDLIAYIEAGKENTK